MGSQKRAELKAMLRLVTDRAPLALRARFFCYNTDCYSMIQYDTSERSERVLNSAMLIENVSSSVASVTDCNDRLHYALISAILIMRGNSLHFPH